MIAVQSLVKRYGSRTAVDDLSFTAQPGQVTGFLGPNGAGKSTTIRCILALTRPDSGTTTINGRPFPDAPAPMREVGALIDNAAPHPGRTGRAHLHCLAASNGIEASRVDDVLADVGLTSAAKRRIAGYSLGMRQRLALAGALLGRPECLILDEPANGLDPEGVRWIRDYLRYLADSGVTVLVSSHLLSEVALLADQLVVIGQGRLIDECPVDEFVARHARSWVEVSSPDNDPLIAAVALAHPDAAVERVDGTRARMQGVTSLEVGRVAARHGFVLESLGTGVESLEDVFLDVTSQTTEFSAERDHVHR